MLYSDQTKKEVPPSTQNIARATYIMTTNFESPLDPDVQRVQDAIDQLMEHFECVQIFANRYDSNDDGNTHAVARGQGNYHARFGMAHEWVVREEERARRELDADDD